VVRPQDLATRGTGKLVVNKDSKFILNGIDTQFTQQAGVRDFIVFSKQLQFEISEVISDTELKLKTELSPEAIELISNPAKEETGVAYKIIPHVDQSVLYEKVHERLENNESIVIFPEGGSHDRSEMLPLKGIVRKNGLLILRIKANDYL
jgi:glycerol-3-phosphate O-acyltransferase/dihydroxyacetone phosphate acyltransferase